MLFFSMHYFSVTQQSKHLDIGISYSVILVSAKGKYAVKTHMFLQNKYPQTFKNLIFQ